MSDPLMFCMSLAGLYSPGLASDLAWGFIVVLRPPQISGSYIVMYCVSSVDFIP